MSDQQANSQGQGQQSSQEPQGTQGIPSLEKMMPQYSVQGGTTNDNSQQPNDFQASQGINQNANQDQNQGQDNPQQRQQGQQNQDQQQDQQQDQGDSPLEEYSFLSGNGENLSQEDKEIRGQVFDMFGASSMDANGNLVDANNNIVLSKANLDNFAKTGEVPTDGNGNQIKEDGSILRPLEDNQPSFIDTTRQLIENEFEFQLLDEQGNPKQYENTAQGQLEMVKDVYSNAVVNSVASFLQLNPQVKDYYYHLATGGQPDSYNFKPVDYSSIEIDKLDKAGKIGLIRSSLDRQKVQNAESIIKTYELASDEIINQSASDALITLDKLTKQEAADKEIQFKKAQEHQKQEADKYWREVKSAVDNNKVANLSIPDKEKDEFFKYLAVPVNSKGLSQNMIDEDNQSMDMDLMVSYMRWKGFKLDDLINLRAKTSNIDALRQRFAGKIPNPSIPNDNKPTHTATGSSELSLDKIIGNRKQ